MQVCMNEYLKVCKTVVVVPLSTDAEIFVEILRNIPEMRQGEIRGPFTKGLTIGPSVIEIFKVIQFTMIKMSQGWPS